MPPPKKEMTVTALERMLAHKRSQLQRLKRRRILLTRQLEKIDRQIAQISGIAAAEGEAKGKGRRRPQNSQPLTKVLIDVLKKHKAGLPLAQLAQRVVATGYKSNSSDFRNVVYQSVYNNRNTIVHDPKTGVYRLK